MSDKYLKYGGVKFDLKVPEQEVNDFVARLPADKRSSLYEVTKKLQEKDLIEIKEEKFSSIDSNLIPFQE